MPGTVKTRLRLHPQQAADLQAAFVRDTVEKACALGFDSVTIAGTPPEGLSLLGALLPDEGVRLVAQSGGDLGERMFAAVAWLFRDVRWSTQTVYRETLERARGLGLSVNEGEPHYDVDTPEDLSRLARELAVRPDHAPYTAEVLRRLV